MDDCVLIVELRGGICFISGDEGVVVEFVIGCFHDPFLI